MLNYLDTKPSENMSKIKRYDILSDINKDIAGLANVVYAMAVQYADEGYDLSIVAQSLDLMHAAFSDVLEDIEPMCGDSLGSVEVERQSLAIKECAMNLERLAASDVDLNESRQALADASEKLEEASIKLDHVVDGVTK